MPKPKSALPLQLFFSPQQSATRQFTVYKLFSWKWCALCRYCANTNLLAGMHTYIAYWRKIIQPRAAEERNHLGETPRSFSISSIVLQLSEQFSLELPTNSFLLHSSVCSWMQITHFLQYWGFNDIQRQAEIFAKLLMYMISSCVIQINKYVHM